MTHEFVISYYFRNRKDIFKVVLVCGSELIIAHKHAKLFVNTRIAKTQRHHGKMDV